MSRRKMSAKVSVLRGLTRSTPTSGTACARPADGTRNAPPAASRDRLFMSGENLEARALDANAPVAIYTAALMAGSAPLQWRSWVWYQRRKSGTGVPRSQQRVNDARRSPVDGERDRGVAGTPQEASLTTTARSSV